MDENQDNSQQVAKDEHSSRLASIKSRAVKELVAIMPQTDEFNAERRFDIYISAIRSSGDVDSAENALNAALEIEDQGLRASALSELIDEVQYLEIKNV